VSTWSSLRFGLLRTLTMWTNTWSSRRFVPGLGPKWEGGLVRYNHPEDLEAYLEQYGHEVAGFLVEPIQGEAG
jgi:acetylornithine/succinyldiaminopimelate/putrescine aminotransferase